MPDRQQVHPLRNPQIWQEFLDRWRGLQRSIGPRLDTVVLISVERIQNGPLGDSATYNNHVEAEYQVENKEATKDTICPIPQWWIGEIEWISVKPHHKADPARDYNGAHRHDSSEASCTPRSRPRVIQQRLNHESSECLHEVEEDAVERPGADVEVVGVEGTDDNDGDFTTKERDDERKHTPITEQLTLAFKFGPPVFS